MSSVLRIGSRTAEGIEFIVLEGEIDMNVAPKVREALLSACRNCRNGVAVDLQGVSYMDSSGIATLVEGMQWKRREGSRFLLVGPRSSVLNTLKLAKLHDFFDIYPNEGEALASLR